MTEYANSETTGFCKDLLSLSEFSPSEFKAILNLADTFKSERESRRFNHQIPGTTLALLFEKPSTRTRVSFEVAMYELGGHAVVLNTKEMQSSRGESPEDTARALSVFCHAIAARVESHSTLEIYSKAASVPVINALSDLYHPCQTVADIQTIRQFKKRIKGVRIAWVGDGNNVCNSLLLGAAISGAHMTVACPDGYSPLPEALAIARHQSEFSGSEIEVIDSAKEAVKGADVVVTDTIVSMGQDVEKKQRIEDFLPEYQINEELMSLAKRDAIFMHCLPAHRGEEVTASVIDGPQSVVWQEAENRLHGQKAILYTLLKKYAKSQKDKVYIGNQI